MEGGGRGGQIRGERKVVRDGGEMLRGGRVVTGERQGLRGTCVEALEVLSVCVVVCRVGCRFGEEGGCGWSLSRR